MHVGEGFDRLVNVFAIIDANRPFLESFHRIFSRGAHCRICVCFLNNRGLIRGESGLISGIIQRHQSGFEGNFAEILGADLIQGGVRLCDRILHGSLDCFWRLLPIRNC